MGDKRRPASSRGVAICLTDSDHGQNRKARTLHSVYTPSGLSVQIGGHGTRCDGAAIRTKDARLHL